MPTTFDETARRLLDGKNFATIATLDPDGSPHTSVVWVKRDGDTVLFSTLDTRRKARNLARDPRIALSVYDLANPYHAVDIRGTAQLLVDEGPRLPTELSQKYLGEDPPQNDPEGSQRLIVKITPERITGFSV